VSSNPSSSSGESVSLPELLSRVENPGFARLCAAGLATGSAETRRTIQVPSLSKAPPSRNWPCGAPPTSANFSTGPIPAGNGGRPQGCTGPAAWVGAWAAAGPTGPAPAHASATATIARRAIVSRYFRNELGQRSLCRAAQDHARPLEPGDRHVPASDRTARSARTAPPTAQRAPSRKETLPAASSWRSAQTPRRQRQLLHPPNLRNDPPHQALYHDHCSWLLQRFLIAISRPRSGLSLKLATTAKRPARAPRSAKSPQ
jgi:hypothetical protein